MSIDINQIPNGLKSMPCWVNHTSDKRPVTPRG